MNDAIMYVLNNYGIDNILEAHRYRGFTEIIGTIGGDVLKLRVYGDKEKGFTITEK